MEAQIAIVVISILGTIFTVWALKNNGKIVEKERMSAIKEKIAGLNGEIVAIEQVERVSFPYSEEYTDPDHMYKFYRIRYEVNGNRKLGYGTLVIKNSNFGSALVMNSEWVWKF